MVAGAGIFLGPTTVVLLSGFVLKAESDVKLD
jgi:hypothetical protein